MNYTTCGCTVSLKFLVLKNILVLKIFVVLKNVLKIGSSLDLSIAVKFLFQEGTVMTAQ